MKLVKLDTRQFYCLVISPIHTLFITYKYFAFHLFILGVLALGGCTRFFLAVLSGWYSLVAVHRLLIAAPSRCTGSRARGLRWSRLPAPRAQAHGCRAWAFFSWACGIFLDQGSNLCLLHWQGNSLPLSHQGSPVIIFVSICSLNFMQYIFSVQSYKYSNKVHDFCGQQS